MLFVGLTLSNAEIANMIWFLVLILIFTNFQSSGMQRFFDARANPFFRKNFTYPAKNSNDLFCNLHQHFYLHIGCCNFNYLIAPFNTS